MRARLRDKQRARRRNREHAAEDEERQAEPSSRPVHALVRLIRVCCCPCVIVIWICICIVFVCGMVIFLSLALVGMLVANLLVAFTTSTEVVTDCARPSALRLAALRFLEYVCHGVILTTIARTACGELPILEIEVFFLLFGLNLASYVAYVMMQYKVQKLAEWEKPLIEICSQIVSPCLESLGRLYSCCTCSAKTLDKE